MRENELIPVVFSTDENYVMPTAVAIRSMMKNYSGERLLIYVLVKNDLSRFSKEILLEAANCNNGVIVEIQYLILGDKVDGASSHISHISVATYYRLFLPELLSVYKKCLYLDGDIIVSGDIENLLEVTMDSTDYIAGVRVLFFEENKRSGMKRAKLLEIPDTKTYINAGILLMNLEALRENEVDKDMVKLIAQNYPVQDQDILNKVCYGHIKVLQPKYNAMPCIRNKSVHKLKKVYDCENILEARKNPVIIHYADCYKPWKYKNLSEAEIWHTIYYELFGRIRIANKKLGLIPLGDKICRYSKIIIRKIIK